MLNRKKKKKKKPSLRESQLLVFYDYSFKVEKDV